MRLGGWHVSSPFPECRRGRRTVDRPCGGRCAERDLGDFGPLRDDATDIPPIISRGILIDVAGFRGVSALDAHVAVGPDELRDACRHQGVELRPGDVALVRTGYLSGWPDPDFIAAHEQAGIDRDAALWLAEQSVVAVAGDTVGDKSPPPSAICRKPQPANQPDGTRAP